MRIMIPAWINDQLVPAEKLDVHVRGLRHKAVSVFILCGTQILIQQRAKNKYHTPGLWANTCCTHPNWGEDSKDCAIRRLDDELGIKDSTVEYRETLEYRADVGNGLIEHEVVDLFVMNVDEQIPVVPNPNEVMDVQWIEYEALQTQIQNTPERFTPWMRIYMTQYADRIFAT